LKTRGADDFWLTRAKLVTPRGVIDGAVKISCGRIAAIRRTIPSTAVGLSMRGGFVAPGFIDLHIWGEPETVSREVVEGGTTSFLTTLGPQPSEQLEVNVVARAHAPARALPGAECLGVHLEGPFLNPVRGGVLPRRYMRAPTLEELRTLKRLAGNRLKLLTIAPELPGAAEAIRWCWRRRITVSLGHSDAEAGAAEAAVAAGARAATHVFNSMRRFHHRQPGLLDVALTDDRVTTLVIPDGKHVSPLAFKLLVRAKGPGRIGLVTDSIRYAKWDVVERRGAYYTRRGILAGSRLSMIRAVHNAMVFGGLDIVQAVRMATEIPAKLLGLLRSRGTLEVGKRADLVGFDHNFRVLATVVGGQVAYQRGL